MELDFPIKDLVSDFELKNELLVRGFVPKTLELQCLLGLPLNEKQIDDEIINSTANIFDKLLKSKAQELIDKYNNEEFNLHCENLAIEVAKQIKAIIKSGYEVSAILGIEQSPSCCVNYIYTKNELKKVLEKSNNRL